MSTCLDLIRYIKYRAYNAAMQHNEIPQHPSASPDDGNLLFVEYLDNIRKRPGTWTVTRLAAELKVDAATIRRHVAEGKIPAIRRGRRIWAIADSTARIIIEAHQGGSENQRADVRDDARNTDRADTTAQGTKP
jgi:hypothetical protein